MYFSYKLDINFQILFMNSVHYKILKSYTPTIAQFQASLHMRVPNQRLLMELMLRSPSW
jgi:hypothetical protein